MKYNLSLSDEKEIENQLKQDLFSQKVNNEMIIFWSFELGFYVYLCRANIIWAET
jgi:hypothetical protein